MAWALSSWLGFTRIWQMLAALAAAGMNGFITGWILTNDLPLTKTIVILQLLICLLLAYTTVALFVQHTGHRTKRKGWLIGFIVSDIIFCAMDLGIISLLSRVGLPDHCAGLTKPDAAGLGPPLPPINLGFSDETDGRAGDLDKYCGYERSFFIIAVVLVFTYIATIVIGSLSIYQTSHTRNTKVEELLDSLERAKDSNADLKLLDSNTSSNARSARLSVAPASEGIITRTASLRSTFTALTASTTSHRGHHIARRPTAREQQQQQQQVQQDQNQPALPPVPSLPSSPPKSTPTNGFAPLPLDEDDSAAAALVTDGMQPHSYHPQQQQPQPAQHFAHRRVASSAQHHQQQTMPMLLEEDQSAGAALVSDGMRPEGMLPPYEPSRGRLMPGHGDEDNDMRLSEYVKGETRAQGMKDDGRY